MIIIKTLELTWDMLDSLTDLVLDVNEADGVRYTVPDDADLYILLYDDGNEETAFRELYDEDELEIEELSGSLDPDSLVSAIAAYEMGETCGGMPVAELAAYTGPEFRGRGFFRLAIDTAAEEYTGYRLRFAVYKGTGVLRALEAIGAEYDHDEIIMKLALNEGNIPPKARSLEVTVSCGPAGDGESETFYEGGCESGYGECSFRIYDSFAYIYGIRTNESHLREGCASEMLRQLLIYLLEKGVPEVMLEVSSDNIPAVRLYRKMGFGITEQLSYYYI